MPFRRVADSPTFHLSRWLFLRLLGSIYLIAFLSLAWQITGLVGENGILPTNEYLEQVKKSYGNSAYRFFPTLVWLHGSDTFLHVLCLIGVLGSALLVTGIGTAPILALLWITYLSLTVVGQTFLQFQWDSLLLETGLLACFYAPLRWQRQVAAQAPPPKVMRLLVWWLLFRLTFLSGITKLVSGDETWNNWTALIFHYETQPLPTWISWYVHHLPEWVHTLAVGGMFFVELFVPLVILAPTRQRRLKQFGCILLVTLQLLIAATGNYGFFNLLTIALCVTLLDDQALKHLLPKWMTTQTTKSHESEHDPLIWRAAIHIVAMLIIIISVLTFFREIKQTNPEQGRIELLPAWSQHLVSWASPFRSINGYGLFRVMTKDRPEIVIEVSQDNVAWREYPFQWKPGDPSSHPSFVAPHQPRLDWQMWFAALSPAAAQYWLNPLMRHILEGTPEVLALLGKNPFLDGPPRYVRLVYYQYRFTSAGQKSKTGAWWHRQFLGYLTKTMSLTDWPMRPSEN